MWKAAKADGFRPDINRFLENFQRIWLKPQNFHKISGILPLSFSGNRVIVNTAVWDRRVFKVEEVRDYEQRKKALKSQ